MYRFLSIYMLIFLWPFHDMFKNSNKTCARALCEADTDIIWAYVPLKAGAVTTLKSVLLT